MSYHPSEKAALKSLQRLFAGAESVTIRQLIINAGRGERRLNEMWLRGRLTILYHYGFVSPIYSFDPYRKLNALMLTPKGREKLQSTHV